MTTYTLPVCNVCVCVCVSCIADIVQELGKDSCSKMLAASERSLVQAFNGLAGIQAKLRPTAAGNPATPADSPGTAVEPKAGSSFGESLPASGVLFNNSDSALQLEGAAEQLVNSVVEVVKNHAGALTVRTQHTHTHTNTHRHTHTHADKVA